MGTEKLSEDPFICLCGQLAADWPPRRWADVPIVVAVSGGADSVALLRALAALHQQASGRGALYVAHFHHRLRGAAADEDARFVERLAADLKLEFQLGYAAEQASDEATMRAMRYRFLGQQAHRLGARYVALGHTLDDNVETLLHQMLRGCGPAGWAGMPGHRELVADVVLMRPLLKVRRSLLLASLQRLQQPWREDATNKQLHWKRNWIRHELLPLVESQYPEAGQRLAQTIRQQADVMQVIDGLAEDWIEGSVTTASDVIVVRPHTAADAVVIHALRKLWDQQAWPRGAMSQRHWRAALEAIQGRRRERSELPGGVAVTVEEEQTVFVRSHAPQLRSGDGTG